MTEKLTGMKALLLLEDVVAEKGGEYVYPYDTCEYLTNLDDAVEMRNGVLTLADDAEITPAPACIVGHVLAKAGMLGADSFIEGVVLGNEEAGALSDSPLIDDMAAYILWVAQSYQDGSYQNGGVRSPWGDALVAARAAHDNYRPGMLDR